MTLIAFLSFCLLDVILWGKASEKVGYDRPVPWHEWKSCRFRNWLGGGIFVWFKFHRRK